MLHILHLYVEYSWQSAIKNTISKISELNYWLIIIDNIADKFGLDGLSWSLSEIYTSYAKLKIKYKLTCLAVKVIQI